MSNLDGECLYFLSINIIMQRNDPDLSDLGVHSGGQSTGHAGTEVCSRLLLLPGSPPSDDEGQYRWGVPPLEELYALVQVRQDVEDSVHAENFIFLPICLLILYTEIFFCPVLFFTLCLFCPFTPSTYFALS